MEWNIETFKFLFQIFIQITIIAGIVLIKFNDLKHLEKDVRKIDSDNAREHEKIDKVLGGICDRLEEVEKDTFYIKGILTERRDTKKDK